MSTVESWKRKDPASAWARLKLRVRGQSGSRTVTFDIDERGVVEVSAEVMRSMLSELGYKPAAPLREEHP